MPVQYLWLTNLALAISLPSALGATQQVAFQPIAAENPVFESSWNDLNARPDANATRHLIFDTVNLLLQHWPNTRYRNGHNIIPGMVPVGTLIYHGRANNSVPDIPEWTATDSEHAYPFCGGPPEYKHHSMLAVHIHGDAPAEANIHAEGAGTLDAQDLLVWGKVDVSRRLGLTTFVHGDENLGSIDVCGACLVASRVSLFTVIAQDGDGFSFILDSEIMLCEFTGGVELLSTDFLAAAWARHVTPPLWDSASLRTPGHPGSKSPPPPGSPPPAPRNKDSEIAPGLRARNIINFEIMCAGSWHNHCPDETCIVLDLTRLISFYDTSLAPSLIGRHAGLERWDHRLEGISAIDLETMTMRLRAMLASDTNVTGSGVDWKTLYRVVVDRYADRLELLEYLLNTMTGANVLERGEPIQEQLRIAVSPVHCARSCRFRCIRRVEGSSVARVLSARVTPSERLLLGALDETSREICRVVVRMARPTHPPRDRQPGCAAPRANGLAGRGCMDAHTLIAWLDWSVWVTCRPACGVEEMCYLPTWPWFLLWDKEEDPEPQPSWKRPQPRCVRLFKPYSVL
ncbi:hypothetical protein DFH09DRAFT_1439233 [Mycena vulgaris]|nr:hypothetical protein DFH09DRAFT_1439233 [Mycena vulgaris]